MGHGCHDCGCPNGCECGPKPSEKEAPFTPYGKHGEVVKITAADAKYLFGKPVSLKPMVPISIDEESFELIEDLAYDKTAYGQRRYYVYDCEKDDWFFIEAGNGPFSLIFSKKPPKFSKIGQELRHATKRTLVVYLRMKIRQLDKQIETWL